MGYTAKQLVDKNTRIGVLYGGLSNEKDVSLRSGKNCYEALLRLGYKNTVLIDMAEDIASVLKKEQIELVYNALHGKYGEDGCVQGLLEILKIPYTGCGVMASSLCMNKFYTKKMLEASGLPLISSVLAKKGEDVLAKTKGLTYPLFLKPVTEGSSIGMYKVNTEKELLEAFKQALEFGNEILIEEFVVGIDATVGVLEDCGKTFATEVLQMSVKSGWYDYEAKYTKGMTEFILPARISEEMTRKVKSYAVNAFQACGCKGLSRVDFVITQDEAYILEINTSPGMTDLSDLPAQSAAMGIDYDNLVQIILNSAISAK